MYKRGTNERTTVDFVANNGKDMEQNIEREKKSVILEFYTLWKGLSKIKAK